MTPASRSAFRRRWLLIPAIGGCFLAGVSAQALRPSAGGAFSPYADYNISGRWDFATGPTIAGVAIWTATDAARAALTADLSVKSYGAVGDGKVVLDGAITFGLSTLTSATASFAATDVGKLVDINGAGTTACGQQYYGIAATSMNCNLVGTIIGYTNATTVTVSVPAGTSVTGAQVKWCTDDTAFLQAAVNALTATGGEGRLYFPVGNYCVSRTVKKAFVNKTLFGAGKGQSNIWQMGAQAYNVSSLYQALLIDNGTDGLVVRDLGFEGTNRYAELTTFGTTSGDGVMTCPGNSTLGGACANTTGMSNITFDNCRFDHFWGIGLHPFGLDNFKIVNSDASYNAYDGFNPGIHDGLMMSMNSATYNGTGGIEATSQLNATISNNYAAFNKVGGLSIGGYSDASGTLASVTVTGNTVYKNGNGSTVNTVGVGIAITANQRNCIVSGNVAKQNHQAGIAVQVTVSGTLTGQCLVRNNIVASNGITSPSVSTYGIYVNANNVVVGGNKVYDEALTGYGQTIGVGVNTGMDGITIEPNEVGAHATADYFFSTNLTNFTYRDPVVHSNMSLGVGTTITGFQSERTYRIPVSSTTFTAAATTQDVTLVTLPAKTVLLAIYASVATTFACTATCTTSTLSATVGSSAGGNNLLVSFDVDAAVAQFGKADADLGTGINRASAIQGGFLGSWTTTTPISLRLTSGTGNLGNGSATNLSQGALSVYLVTRALP